MGIMLNVNNGQRPGYHVENVERLKTPVEMLAKMQVEKRPESKQNPNGKTLGSTNEAK